MKLKRKRNNKLYDTWSLIHLATGILLGWIMSPFVALLLTVLWEPLEILVLSPILAKFNIIFGYVTIRNSLSDIVFDCLGVAIGYYILSSLVTPPFILF